MMDKPKKSYYAIIPANVRYDSQVRPNAKLLYGEITALCNEKGYCWASNQYFADLYSVSKQSISAWIKELIDNGYITSDLIYKEGSKEILNRYIRIAVHPIQENLNTPIQEKLKDNNTSFNTTSNNTSNKESAGQPDDIPYIDIINYLNHKAGKDFKVTTAKTRSLIKARWNEGFTLEDFKRVIDNKVADWKNDQKWSAYLRPATLFNGDKFEGYLNEVHYQKKEENNGWPEF